MGTDWQSGTPRGTDYQRDSDGHTDWQRNANQGTDWQPKPQSPAQSIARVDARRKNKYLGLNKIIDRANRKKRGKGRIGVAANRGAINKGIAVARPTGTTPSQGGGLVSPLTEQERVTEIVRICDPGDATVWVEVEAATQITFTDAVGTEFILNLTPDTTGNCP